jgi:hypothetical protein
MGHENDSSSYREPRDDESFLGGSLYREND